MIKGLKGGREGGDRLFSPRGEGGCSAEPGTGPAARGGGGTAGPGLGGGGVGPQGKAPAAAAGLAGVPSLGWERNVLIPSSNLQK